MKVKTILLSCAGLTLSANSLNDNNSLINDTKIKIIETLKHNPKELVTVSTMFEEDKKNRPNNINQNSQTIAIQDLKGTPFRGEKRMIKPTYGNLLGYSQAETIMKEYNTISSDFSLNQELLGDEQITFPLIYPELKEYFPQKLNDLLSNPIFEKYKNQTKKHTLIVSCCDNEKIALAYYENGKLRMATYVSPGTKNHKTITGDYPLKHSSIYRRSKKYNNSAMPYAIQIDGGYFLHQGRSNGSPQSHGCIRVPGLYQKWLYEYLPRIQGKSIIILEGLYTPTLNKINSEEAFTLGENSI